MSLETLTERGEHTPARTPMTSARRLILAIGLPVLIGLIGWTGLNIVAWAGTGSYQFSSALPVSGGTLTADLDGDGNVTLVPGPAARLAGTITYSLIRPDVAVHGGSVSYRCPVPFGQCSLDSTLSVPAGTGVSLSAGSGNLTVNGSGITGDVSLSTTAGDLTASDFAGHDLTLRTSVGVVTATGIAARDVTVRSSTGDITLTFAQVPDRVTVSAAVGSVSIVLPAGGARYHVVASSSIGNVSVSPGVHQDATSARLITVNSSTGDISVTTS